MEKRLRIMTKKLKVYRGNYNGRQGRAVAAPSKTKAAELIGVSMHTFKQFFGNGQEEPNLFFAKCLQTPEVVYQYNLSDYSSERKLIPILKGGDSLTQ